VHRACAHVPAGRRLCYIGLLHRGWRRRARRRAIGPSMSIRLLSENDVRALAPGLREIVTLVEQAYRLEADRKAQVPTKTGVHPGNSLLHAMPAWIAEAGALGMKWISYFPDNAERGLAAAAALIILNDPKHGRPCCIMEGMHVTFLRTAACAAVAAKHL